MRVVDEIKSTKNLSIRTYFLSSFLISNRISPYISAIYIKLGVIPNMITIHMILSGIIGAVLFSLPNLLAKIAGATFIHLWFILDCSDGEVARYTKKYSKYGKELDFMAHLINHPLFGIALFFSLFQLGRYDFHILFYIVVASNFLDYLNRNLNTLQLVIDTKSQIENKGYMPTPQNWTLKKLVMFVTNIFTIYPNLILFGVFVYFIDYALSTDFLYYYLILNVVLTFLFSIWGLFKFTKRFYNS